MSTDMLLWFKLSIISSFYSFRLRYISRNRLKYTGILLLISVLLMIFVSKINLNVNLLNIFKISLIKYMYLATLIIIYLFFINT